MSDLPGTGWLAAWAAAAFLVGGVGTWLARRYATHRRLLDQPGERRSHAVATPRGGGISIAVAWIAALGGIAALFPAHAVPALLAAAGAALVAGIGWIDDHRPLSPWLRLAVHAAAAALLALAVQRLGGGWGHVLVAFVAALVLTNVWNFMDGIDGLAASQAALVAAGYALVAGDGGAMWLGVALAAACCGFLPFNLPRARIFLGDVGSGVLGFALAGLLALAAMRFRGPDALLLLLPLSPFLVDASLTLLSRIVRGEAWWTAHVQHAYQVWARSIGRHSPVTSAYAAACLLATAAMFGARSCETAFIIVMVTMFLLACAAAWIWLRKAFVAAPTPTDGANPR